MSVDRMARNCCACNVRVRELTGLRVIYFCSSSGDIGDRCTFHVRPTSVCK